MFPSPLAPACGNALGKVKIKVRTLDLLYRLFVKTSPQKRCGTARIIKGFHSFSCYLHTDAFAGSHFTGTLGMEGSVSVVGWLHSWMAWLIRAYKSYLQVLSWPD